MSKNRTQKWIIKNIDAEHSSGETIFEGTKQEAKKKGREWFGLGKATIKLLEEKSNAS